MVWWMLVLAPVMAFQVFLRPAVRRVHSRVLADIDLHSEAIDVDFDGPAGLVVLSHGGIVAFDLAEPKT